MGSAAEQRRQLVDERRAQRAVRQPRQVRPEDHVVTNSMNAARSGCTTGAAVTRVAMSVNPAAASRARVVSASANSHGSVHCVKCDA